MNLPYFHPARLFAGVLAAALSVLAPCAAATDYPDRPVQLVVPFPPGGGADNLARAIMPKVSLAARPADRHRQPAGGRRQRRRRTRRARSPPDGYTLLYGTNGTHSINQSLYQQPELRPDQGLRAGVADDRDRGDADRQPASCR